MSVTDEHRMSPSKVLAKTKKNDKAKDKDDDEKQDSKSGHKGNAMLEYIAKCKAQAKK